MKQPIFTGSWGKCHIQGIAADLEKGYIYYSFTTRLVKAKLDGTVIGCVDGLMGHLGCIAFRAEDGRVYGSLEYKSDSIGRGILSALGGSAALEDAFYIAIFDVDKIDRMDMDAEKDGVMTTVYLKTAADDYNGAGRGGAPHKYGCSGIDGTAFAPLPGAPLGKRYLYVAYGIYGEIDREDNDHQVLLCYDVDGWAAYARPLSQASMHRSGPEEPAEKYFVYTGNTTYGVQNLEYDAAQQALFMAVYPGKKEEFPNYRLFAADLAEPAEQAALKGLEEAGKRLRLKRLGAYHPASDTYGWHFPYGATGLFSCGGGRWLISEPHLSESGQCSWIYSYVWNEKTPFVLAEEGFF